MLKGVSIGVKMMLGSTLLLVAMIGVLAMLTTMQGDQIIDECTIRTQKMRQRVQRAAEALEKCGAKVVDQKALDAELAAETAVKQEELGTSLRNVVIFGVLGVLLGVLLSILQSMKITHPLKELTEKANLIANGDLGARVEVKSRDELGQLGTSFNYMAEQLSTLVQATAHKVMMEKELEVVSAVQASLVPSDDEVELTGLSLASFFSPAAQCGGDWWDFYRLDRSRTLVLVGDVTGHGAASAMITAAAKGAATATKDLHGPETRLPALLKAMNATIHEVAKGRFVMTCFASIYDASTHQLEYANAGHVFPYIYQQRKLRPLVARGNRLGDVSRSDFEVSTIEVEPDAAIVWFTDGIVEGENAGGEKYGERRFRKSVEMVAELKASHARNAIVARAHDHYGDVPPKDDITLVVGRFVEPLPKPPGA